jgi:hypothetical protein
MLNLRWMPLEMPSPSQSYPKIGFLDPNKFYATTFVKNDLSIEFGSTTNHDNSLSQRESLCLRESLTITRREKELQVQPTTLLLRLSRP